MTEQRGPASALQNNWKGQIGTDTGPEDCMETLKLPPALSQVTFLGLGKASSSLFHKEF